MLNNNSNKYNIGDVFVCLLTSMFIILKLFNKITWSWLWVLSPIWISAIIMLVIIIVIFLLAFFSIK